jgi:putative solute:sodium symporter small subunit
MPKPPSAQQSRQDRAPENHTRHWRHARAFTAILLVVWFVTTFGVLFFARELSGMSLFGWPFSFYMAAQGLTLFYLLLIALYIAVMRTLDRRFREQGGGDAE